MASDCQLSDSRTSFTNRFVLVPYRQEVFFTLAFPDDDLGLLKVNVFHPQAQAAAVKQAGHQLVQPVHFIQHLADFVFGKHRWQALGWFGAQGVDG